MRFYIFSILVYKSQKLLPYFLIRWILSIAKKQNYLAKQKLSKILALNFFDKAILERIKI